MKRNRIVRQQMLFLFCILIDIFQDSALTHLLQAETKHDFDIWLLALKQTAYSRIGGGKLNFIALNKLYKLEILYELSHV